MHRITFGFALALLSVTGEAASQQQGSIFVAGSDQANFSIVCTMGKETVWGIYPRDGISEWEVARDIEIHPLPNGRVVYSFKRGFTTGTIPGTYMPADDVACETFKQ